MKILIAPDKFKASLTADEAAAAIRKGFSRIFPDARIVCVPVADGGEGTAATLAAALDGGMVECPARDALGNSISAAYAWIPATRTAVVEMSQAAGLWRISDGDRDPMRADTRGVGMMIADAVARGAETVLVGLGGSATNDAGCGMAHALGWRFFDCSGNELEPLPVVMAEVGKIVAPGSDAPDRSKVRVIGICDVRNPLLGENGASVVFGPQKGASQTDVAALERTLARVADVVEGTTGRRLKDGPGAGAAGGLGFGLMVFADAELKPGFETIAALLKLPAEVERADLVVTAEGKLDRQTGEGKVPDGVAALAAAAGKPVIAFGGALEHEEHLHRRFDALIPLANRPMQLDESQDRAAELLERAAERAARLIRIGKIL